MRGDQGDDLSPSKHLWEMRSVQTPKHSAAFAFTKMCCTEFEKESHVVVVVGGEGFYTKVDSNRNVILL